MASNAQRWRDSQVSSPKRRSRSTSAPGSTRTITPMTTIAATGTGRLSSITASTSSDGAATASETDSTVVMRMTRWSNVIQLSRPRPEPAPAATGAYFIDRSGDDLSDRLDAACAAAADRLRG